MISKKELLEKMGELSAKYPIREMCWKELYYWIKEKANSLPDDQPKGEAIYPGSQYKRLFDHMSQNHNMPLLQDEMDEIIRVIKEMTDQPDLLPFEWPVPEGYEVVTRDGREVVKIDFWDMLEMPVLFAVEEYSEVFEALPDGKVCLSRQSDLDLFLRRVEKNVWVVEWHNGAWSVSDKKPYPNPKANIYEAILKQINQQSI